MRLVIVGDVHGKVTEFQNLIKRRTEPEDIVLQVGDMGVGFGEIPDFPANVKFIRGNHDDPAACLKHPNYLGEFGYKPEWNLFYMGGAWSIDYAWRKAWNAQKQYEKEKYKSSTPAKKIWWEDEQLSEEQLAEAKELYIRTKPEIVITHEAPASIVPKVLIRFPEKLTGDSPLLLPDYNYQRPEKLECIKTRTSETLQQMLDLWRPRWWIFGHYHISRGIDTGSTFFKCAAELEPFYIELKNETTDNVPE